MTTPTILLPLDGTEHALAALPVAKSLACHLGAVVRVLHVAPEEVPRPMLLDRQRLTDNDLHGCVLDIRKGDPGEVIIDASRQLDFPLMVMCTRTGLPTPDGPTGIIAEKVILSTHSPVVFVDARRGFHPWELKSILVPHDGTPATVEAIVPTAELARHAGASLTVLHVTGPGVTASTEPGSLMAPMYLDQPQHEWPAWAAEFLGRLARRWPLTSLQLRLVLGRGEAAAEILRHARLQRL